MGGTDFHVLKLLILISVIKIISVGGYSLNNFYPPWGGSNGATPVRLHGEFTINPFNTGVGPEIPELKVFFIGEHQVFEAEVEKDSTKEHVIGCYTRPMPVGKYKICVEIEGDQYCKSTFHVVWWRTPYIAEFLFSADHDSFAGTPRSLLTVDGRIFTDVYGTNDIRMLGSAEELTIRRVYAGSEDCSLVDENDDLYGLQLDSEGSWDGEFTCKMNSEYVGNNNFSFIVTGYGRSKVNENLMRITGEDKIYMFQTYAEVTGISPQSGSEEGGTIITVSGRYFDPNPTKDTHVWVGRELCEIIDGSQTDTELKCITPSKPSIMELYPGSRGVNVEVWYDTQMNLDDARVTLNSTHDGYDTWEADSAGYSFENVTTIVKITGTFEVPVDDKYQFYIRSDDGSVLYLSCDGNSANVEKVAYASSYAPHFRHFSSQKSDWMDLDKGQFCYFEGLVQNYQGPGNIYIGVLRATTTLTSAQSANAWMERQQILWQAQEKKEKQVLFASFINPQNDKEINQEMRCKIVARQKAYTGKSVRKPSATLTEIDIDSVTTRQPVCAIHLKFMETRSVVDAQKVISLINWNPETPLSEVQTVEVSSNCYQTDFPDVICASEFYVLSYRGRHTNVLSVNALDFDVQEALNKIMPTDDVEVSVTSTPMLDVNGNEIGTSYEVTFSGYMGDEPALVVEHASANVTVEVSEDTKGSPNFLKFSLNFLGRITDAIRVDATAEDVQEALGKAREAKCVDELMKLSSLFIREFLHFEGNKPSDYSESGERTKNMDAFCGSSSLLNPHDVFDSGRDHFSKYSVEEFPYFCFAHKGLFLNKLSIKFEYVRPSDGRVLTPEVKFFENEIVMTENAWSYSCFNIEEAIKEHDDYMDAQNIKILRLAGFQTISNQQNFYIDEVLITRTIPDDLEDIVIRRQPPAMYQGEVISSIEVEKLESNHTEFEITFSPYNCAHDLPLLSVVNAPMMLEQSVDASQYNGIGWPVGTVVNVTRTQKTNIPVGGTFDISYDDDELGLLSYSGIPGSIALKELEAILESMGLGDMKVWGHQDYCYSRRILVEWVANGGDKKMFDIDDTNIQGEEDLQFHHYFRNGGALHAPFGGDMTRRMYSESQVEVLMNGIHSRCDGDCSFSYSNALTPVLTSSSPSSGSNPTPITIVGTNLDESSSGSEVLINGVECTITSHTSTEIICTTGSMEYGDHDIIVRVGGKGYGTQPDPALSYTQLYSVSSISPSSSFTPGGIFLTLTGVGLSSSLSVEINFVDCPVVSASPTTIQCVVPPSSTEASYSVELITNSGTRTTVGTFEYSNAGMPVVTSISGENIMGPGGTSVILSGSNFGTVIDDILVTIGGQTCEILNLSDTSIECTSPYLSSGTYSLEVLLTGLGAADLGTNSIPDIVYTFIVTDIQPRMTSLFGGQTLELTGNGFLEDTTVSLGYVDCEVTNIMSTSLSCTLGSTAQIHYIYNEGSHADFGFGYAWLPDVMTIVQGDTVVWDWYFPEWIDDIDGIEIFETSVPDGLTHNGGFLSGYDRTLTGTFSHTFTSVGTFYYSSGYVDDEDYGSILMSGTINVVALSDISLGLEVQNNGIPAEINLVTNDGITKRGAPCVPLNAGIDGCAPSRKKRDIGIRSRTKRGTGSIVTITEDYKNQFLHSHNNARSNAYPQGSNIILMEWNDEIAANAESYAEQCTWGHSTSASRVTSDHGQLGENLAIYTRGNSLSNIANAAVVDWADEVAFYNFSTLSCQDTEVCGHYTQVIWDDSYALGCAIADCEEADIENDPFTDATYQGAYYIVCQYGPGGNFNPSTNPPYDEGVPCSNCPAEFPACDSTYTLCAKETGGGGDGNGDGDVTASVCFTPTITSISPQFGTVDDVITIEGTGFGDDSCRISVVIGDDISCTVNSSTTTAITCTPNPNAGANIGISYEVIVNVLGYGDAFVDIPTDADKRFALLPSISSITPATGSLAGGTYIDILGTGFMDDVTSVNIGGDDCEIIGQDYVSINCKTSSGSQGSQTVGVVVNSYQAVCLSSCDFLFDVSVTPSVSSIEPNSVSSENTAIHITGTGFDGDSSDVMIGDSTCVIDSINATHIECTIAELIAGNFETKVHISPKGYADFEASNIVTGESIATLSATSGSVFGGSVFTIAGHGFNSDDLSVTFDGSDAEIMLKMNKLLLVKTPPGTAGNKDVVIVSNGVTYPTLQFTYDAALTPLVTSILPTSGGVGTTVTITGTMLNATASTNEVKIGDAICTITSETATEIQCSTGEPSIGGEKEITVFVGGHGNADTTSVTFTYDMEISSFSPVEGSYGGGNTITITGSGFSSDATVHVGYSICEVDSVVYGSISCTLEETPSLVARDDAIESFEVLLNSFDITVFDSLPRDDYQVIGQYASDCINCDTLISNLPTYRIGNGDALVNPVSYNQIMTNGAAQISVWEPVPPSDSYVCLGSFIVTGTSPPELDATACIHYMLVEESTPTLELDATTLYIWSITDSPFVLYTASSTPPTVYKLKDMSQAMSNMQYPITIDNDGTEVMSATNFTFKSALTPVVTSVTPTRGGTGGGTPITITGTGFSVDTADVSVTIGGVVCDVTSTSLTTIECTTNSRNGSIETAVIVNIAGKGQSLDIGAKFYYIDLWSSIWTWGGRGIPGDDTFIVIPAGMEIMIDENTAILKMLLIQGGKVFFDEADIELNAKNILITDGGVLQVGTEDEPFQHKAIITLHGHLRSIELPIYGTKTIAVRDGMLDLHGKYVPVTWTYLSATANAGTNVITVDNPVTWEAGDEIVIASTGHRHSQEENEKHTILSVAGDQVTITLETALEFDHLGVVETMPDGTVLKSRAEVGLLTHNVLVRGSRNMDWSEDIPACPEGFNTGEFAQQTCFQGRFGEEMGSDQFGGQIMFHHPSPDEQKAFGRISYVELNYMGQAFRLGRYAIHYHLMGDMNYKNYVRGCGIHETFNRAVTIHDTHKALVEKNVIFNSMGGTIFIEDGLETKNKIIGNLVVFCRQSTSLQNDDVTPAAFWITNADNIVEDNAAAGGTHFGYWFRMHKHPSGPSHTTSICPRKVALGSFSNNTAHSQGWFGVWIFQEFTPKSGSCCWCDQNEIAVLTGLEVWNCEKGAEFVQTGSVKIRDSKFYNNDKAGVEVKMMKPLVWGETGLENSVIVGHTSVSGAINQMTSAIVLPYSDGWMTENVTFINFDRPGGAVLSTTQIDGTCAGNCGGFHSRFKGIKHHNTANLGIFRWEHENYIEDMDGSLTKTGNPSTVIAKTDTAPPSCIEKTEWSVRFPGMVCPEMRLHRIAWNNAKPTSLDGSLVNLTNQYGRTQVPFEQKRMTHKPGWMALLFDGEEYEWTYNHLPKMANVTYDASYYNYQPNDCNIMRHQFTQTPDMFLVAKGQLKNNSLAPLDCSSNEHGDYYFNDATKLMEYIVRGDNPILRRKRALDTGDYWADPTALNRDIHMNTFRCYFADCIPPPDPNTIPPARERPDDFVWWSDTSIWEDNVLPTDNTDVTIESGDWVVADIDLPIFNTLWLEGVLELQWEPTESGDYKNFTIQATYIFIRGGRLIIGWEDNLFRGLANIILTGDRDTEDFAIVQGVNMGAKAIGVFGGLDMHGIKTTTSWTSLSQSVSAGSSTIVLSKAVDWKVGDDIMITTTSYDPWETETFKITDISVDKTTLTLNSTVQYDHIAETYTYTSNPDVTIAAEVGLLTRNIKVIGNEYPGSDEESFGGRIIVGQYFQGGIEYKGYARIEDVEFLRMGQEGYSDSADPRYSLVYWKSGTSDLIKPSYVKRCAFFRNFNTAIGAFQANNIVFEDNVILHTVGSGVIIEGSDNSFTNNIVALMINPGTYRDKTNAIWYWFGAVKTSGATSVYMSGNVVAGSERAAYWIGGEPCSNPTWGTNTARASLQGVYLNKFGQVGCTTIRNFNIHHSYDYGIYFQDSSDAEIHSCTITDSAIGIITLFNGPSATSHVFEDKYALIKDTTVIAITKPGVCAASISPAIDYLDTSPNFRPPRTVAGNSVNVGLFGASFMSAHNACTKKPCAGLMQYPALGGEVKVEDVAFINFDDASCGIDNIIFMPNSKNEDFQHPVFFSGITFEASSVNTKVLYLRPSIGKVNPSDCVDMTCDGLNKMILTDLDGSFLGSAGTVIPQAEFEWDGDARRGLGDYRIPKTMLTRTNGSRIPVEEIAPHKGILRANGAGKNCVYQSDWQAYECHGYNHQLFIIESLDWDSETRRISPVALLSEGYIDLINGPQDHGWCAGYTCQLRLSTFYTITAIDHKYEIHFSGSSPQKLRLRLPHAASNEAIVTCLFYSTSNRLDVFSKGAYVLPKNGYYEGTKVLTRKPPANDTDFYMPTFTDPVGSNYYSRERQTICITVRGNDHVDIEISNAVYLSFGVPSVTTEEFFDDLITNLALLLNVPEDDIWIAEIVREEARRKKRGVGITRVRIGIGKPPSQTPPAVTVVPRSEVDENGTIIDPGTISQETSEVIAEQEAENGFLNQVTAKIANAIQLGNLSEALGAEMTETAIFEPLPPPTSEKWADIVEILEETGGTLIPVEPIVPTEMQIVTQPGPNLMRAGEPFRNQPKLKFLDANGNVVPLLGTEVNPWIVTARFYSGISNGANLIGETTASFMGSYAEFEDLGIDIEGNYQLEFFISTPETDPPAFAVASNSITLRTPRTATNCTDEEGEDKFDKEYVYEGNCSSLCLFNCEGEDEQCSDLISCGPHSECVAFECMCKENFGFDENDPDNLEELLNPEIYCMPGHMELRLDKCGLNSIGFYLNNLFIFGDGPVDHIFYQPSSFDNEIQRLDLSHDCNTCRGEVSATTNGVAYSFSIAENFTDCNADVVENATHIIYRNMIRGSRATSDGMIIRDRPLEVQFTCNYVRTLWKTLDTALHPFINKITFDIESEGSYEIVMGIWEDSQYLMPAQAPIEVHVPDPIYVAVLANGVSDVILYMDSCFATASSDPDDEDHYDLISGGCPSGEDVTMAKNGINNEDLYSFESFVFADHPDNTTMYLHCQVVVCVHDTTECTPNCEPVRKRRDNHNKLNHLISIGPISVIKDAGQVKGNTIRSRRSIEDMKYARAFHSGSAMTSPFVSTSGVGSVEVGKFLDESN